MHTTIDKMIYPGEHCLIWADNSPEYNGYYGCQSDLHLGLLLTNVGGCLSLFYGSGTNIVVYGAQSNNVSTGRLPDGHDNITTFTNPSPRISNY
jgi:hypothetical protein